MKILFTRFPFTSAEGGAENQTTWLADGLRARGHAVSFLGSCSVLQRRFRQMNLSGTELDIGAPPVTKWLALSFFWRRHAMKEKLIDAVSAMKEKPEAIVMLSLTEKLLLTEWVKKQGIKVLWVEHDRVGPWLSRNPWLRSLVRQSSHALTVCVSELSAAVYRALGFDAKKVIAIPNGVPFPSSPSPFSRGEKGGDEERVEKHPLNPTILTFARSMRAEPTQSEELLWQRLRDKQTGWKFRRQHPIQSRILDFYCHEARLGIEVDGTSHDDPGQRTYDQERTEILGELGIRILRFRNEEMMNDMNGVIMRIKQGLVSPLPTGEGSGVRAIAAPIHLGCVARLSPEKGIDVLLEAIADLPEVRLTIVGTGSEEGYLRSLISSDAERMGGSRIDIRSTVPEVAAFFAEIDALVLPSREHDPFGLVAAEAMMRGKPVLVTSACGIADYLKDGEDAIVVAPDDPMDMKRGIRRLLAGAVRDHIAVTGMTRARALFSLATMVDRYEAALRR